MGMFCLYSVYGSVWICFVCMVCMNMFCLCGVYESVWICFVCMVCMRMYGYVLFVWCV